MNKMLINVIIILAITFVWAGSRFMQKDSIGIEIENQISALCQVSECHEIVAKEFENCFNEGFKIIGLPIKAKPLYSCIMKSNNKQYLEYNEDFVKAIHKKFMF